MVTYSTLSIVLKCARSWVNTTLDDSEKRDNETPYDRMYISQLQNRSETLKKDVIKEIESQIVEYFSNLQHSFKEGSNVVLECVEFKLLKSSHKIIFGPKLGLQRQFISYSVRHRL